MSQVNPHWTRWIHASVNQHFHDNIELSPLNPIGAKHMELHVVGENYDTDFTEGCHAELRVDGPLLREQSKGKFKALIQVNIFLSVDMSKNINVFYEKLGIIQLALTTPIGIFKYGELEGVDDGTQITCVTTLVSSNPKVGLETNNFGQIDPNVKLQQSACEAHYAIYLTK